ncbi:MAG: TRAP transporter substrate-binding protein [Beijerinckiaceae bacterium]
MRGVVSSERHKRQGQAPASYARVLTRGMAAVVISGCALAFSTGGGRAETRWDLPVSSAGTSVPGRHLRVMAEMAAALSGNELQISVHETGKLMAAAEIKDAVRKGVVPIGEITLGLHAGESPIYGLDTVPFVAMSYPEARQLYALQRPLLEKRLGDEGLVLLASIPFPPLGLCARKPLTDVADLAGLRIRAYNGLTKKMALRSGAEAVPVETSDLPKAVKSGIVDAFTASPSQALSRKAAAYTPYFHRTNVWIPRNAVVVNRAAFDGLPAADRKALLDAASKAEEQGWIQSEAEARQLEERLTTAGFSVVDPSADFMTGVRRIGREILTDWLKDSGEDGAALLDRIYKN